MPDFKPSSTRSSTRKKKKRRSKTNSDNSASQKSSQSHLKSLTPQEVLQQSQLAHTSIPTLIELGILTAKGGASPHARRKIKQVSHFLQLLQPALEDLFQRYDNPCIIDMGAGKSAISLALYDRWIRTQQKGHMIAVENRTQLVDKVKHIADQGDYHSFSIQDAQILHADIPERAHLVLGLHACDLATDHALFKAIRAKSDYIAMVPCCQAELASKIKQSQSLDKTHPLWSLWSDPMHRREFSAHLTNVIRVYVLRSLGYAVTVTELIGWEHSLKNELILARRVGRYHKESQHKLQQLLQQITIQPWLVNQLQQHNILSFAASDSPTSSDNSASSSDL